MCVRRVPRAQQHLLVSLKLLDKCAFMEERLQPLLGVVVAELLEGGPPLLLCQPGVLETRSVDDQQRAERVLTGLQSSEEQDDTGYTLVLEIRMIYVLAVSTSGNIWHVFIYFIFFF